MPAAVAIPAIATVASGALSSMGGKQQASMAEQAASQAAGARGQAMQATGLGNLGQIANMLFPGLMGGATRPDQAGSAGGLAVQQLMGLLQNPGQLSTATFQRAQEQANVGLQGATRSATAGLTGQGIDPNTPMGQSLAVAASLGASKQRNEAARDYSLAQEQLRRSDIQQGTQGYLGFLQQVMGLGGQQAAAAVGGGFPQVQPINPYQGLATGIGQLGTGLARYYGQQQTASQPQYNVPGATPDNPYAGVESPNV